jgi:hypothetical protein
LSAGDYYSVTYSDCVNYSGDYALKGNIVISALSKVPENPLDVKNQISYISTFNDFSKNETDNLNVSSYTFKGAVSYVTDYFGLPGTNPPTFGFNGINFNAKTTDYSLTLKINNSIKTFIFKNANVNQFLSTIGQINVESSYNLLSISSDSNINNQLKIDSKVTSHFGFASSNNYSQPMIDKYTVSGVNEGSVTGYLPSGLITIDNGNNGTIDTTFYQAF